MSYEVYFKRQTKTGMAYVGSEWITYTSNTADMIKAACGSYPSYWDGKFAREVDEILLHGIRELLQKPELYRCYESEFGFGTVDDTRKFLTKIHENCLRYPDAKVEIICN